MYPTLGIGYQSGVEFGAPTFIQALHDQGQIEGKLISTAYSYSPGTTDGGTLYLGAINFTYVHGHFTNYSFIRDDSRDGLMSLPVGENGRVILATSSPMNLVPEAYYVQFVEGILGSGNYSNTTAEELTYALFDCALRQGMPAIEYPTGSGIWLGPNQYVIPSASLCMSSFAFTGPDHRFYNEYTLGSFSALNDIVAVIDYERNTYGRATLAMPPS